MNIELKMKQKTEISKSGRCADSFYQGAGCLRASYKMVGAPNSSITREDETATLLLRYVLNFSGFGGSFAPHQISR